MRLPLSLLRALGTAALWLPALALPAAQLNFATTCGIAGLRESMLRQINDARAAGRACGSASMGAAPPLAWNDALFTAAVVHSRDMARRDYFEHASPEGERVGARVTAAGYAWRTVGENIAGGDKQPERVMSGWLNSPGHCSNIMRPEYTEVAVACVERSHSEWGTYWTMVLARRR